MAIIIPLPVGRLTGMLAKIEVTEQVDPTPVVGTDGVRISGNFWNVIKPHYAWENARFDAATGSIYPVAAAIPRGSWAELDFGVEIKGPGIAYSASIKPEDDPLAQACGWTSVFSGGGGAEIVTRTLLASAHKSCTIYGYGGGLRYIVVGCRGTLNKFYRAGELAATRYQMMGVLSSITAIAQPAISSYDTTSPVASVNMGLSIGPYDPTFSVAEYAQGANVQRFDSGNAVDGIAKFDWLTLNDGFPLFKVTAKGPDDGTGKWDTANFNPWADATARTSRALDLTVGSTQYNREKMNVATTYVKMPDNAEENGAAAVNLEYVITDSAMSFVSD